MLHWNLLVRSTVRPKKIDFTSKLTLHAGFNTVYCADAGCPTGNGEKLISSQAEPGQAIYSAVA